jgi:hypothetical protein
MSPPNELDFDALETVNISFSEGTSQPYPNSKNSVAIKACPSRRNTKDQSIVDKAVVDSSPKTLVTFTRRGRTNRLPARFRD